MARRGGSTGMLHAIVIYSYFLVYKNYNECWCLFHPQLPRSPSDRLTLIWVLGEWGHYDPNPGEQPFRPIS